MVRIDHLPYWRCGSPVDLIRRASLRSRPTDSFRGCFTCATRPPVGYKIYFVFRQSIALQSQPRKEESRARPLSDAAHDLPPYPCLSTPPPPPRPLSALDGFFFVSSLRLGGSCGPERKPATQHPRMVPSRVCGSDRGMSCMHAYIQVFDFEAYARVFCSVFSIRFMCQAGVMEVVWGGLCSEAPALCPPFASVCL